nr:hypothetical protein [uncultured Oscillibacter sp.]
MNQTTNYQLSQWDREDRILRENFNADNAKIDAALKAEAEARQAADDALTGEISLLKTRFYSGRVAGNGQVTHTISLPGRPLLVIMASEYDFLIGIPGGGRSLVVYPNNTNAIAQTCSTTGNNFTWGPGCNVSGNSYYVFAILAP